MNYQRVPFFDDFRTAVAQLLHVLVDGVRDETDQDRDDRHAHQNGDEECEALARFLDRAVVATCEEEGNSATIIHTQNLA